MIVFILDIQNSLLSLCTDFMHCVFKHERPGRYLENILRSLLIMGNHNTKFIIYYEHEFGIRLLFH